jgi:hypothetical protein
MEIMEYVPGALVAGWMVYHLAVRFLFGPAPQQGEQNA